DVLKNNVFPRLIQLCLFNSLRFQPIDLRWGVPEEASKDNRAMRICLRELARCAFENFIDVAACMAEQIGYRGRRRSIRQWRVVGKDRSQADDGLPRAQKRARPLD